MTHEQIRELCEATESDYAGTKNREFEGLKILMKYTDELSFSAEHDQLWVHLPEERIEAMSKEDIVEMAKMGWFLESEWEGSWTHFV